MMASLGIHMGMYKYRLKGIENIFGKGSRKMTFCVIYVLKNGKFIYTWSIFIQEISIFQIISNI